MCAKKGEEEDTDSKFYDSVWDSEDGDDDIFDATVDREVDDYNKVSDIVEQEDDAAYICKFRENSDFAKLLLLRYKNSRDSKSCWN
jgi:hypothetical protein